MTIANLRRVLFITFLSTNAATVVQFLVTLVLARLLTPSEVGIFSITVVFINIIAVFRDFGVSSYLQREPDLSPQKIRAALGLLITSSWTLAAMLYAISGLIAAYYAQPGIQKVLHVLTISYMLVPFASYFHSLLARDLQAGKQAIVNAVSTFGYAAVCLTLAYLGYSYMALAWANVGNLVITIITFLFLIPQGTPLTPSFREWKGPVRHGGGAILGNLLNKIHSSLPDLLLGKLSGPYDVGLFSRANGLVGIFSQIASPTIAYSSVPFIAKNHHAGIPLEPILSKATSYLTVASWPFFLMTAVYAEQIIHVLYGKQWVAAAPIAMFLCLQAAAAIGYSLSQPALMAIGKPYMSAISAIVGLVFRLGIILLFNAKDVISFAAAICVADILTLVVPAMLMHKYLGFTSKKAIQAYGRSLMVTLPCLLVLLACKWLLPTAWPSIATLAVAGSALAATWICAVFFFGHPIKSEIELLTNRFSRNRTA